MGAGAAGSGPFDLTAAEWLRLYENVDAAMPRQKNSRPSGIRLSGGREMSTSGGNTVTIARAATRRKRRTLASGPDSGQRGREEVAQRGRSELGHPFTAADVAGGGRDLSDAATLRGDSDDDVGLILGEWKNCLGRSGREGRYLMRYSFMDGRMSGELLEDLLSLLTL